jgi:hypothetical protein
VLLAALTSTALCGELILIDFDTDPSSATISDGTIIDSIYASLGLFFEATESSNCGVEDHVYASSSCLTQGTTSPPNVVTVCAGCSDISEDAHGLVRATFTNPAAEVCVEFISSGEDDGGVIRAYDDQHTLLDEATSGEGVSTRLCVSSPGIVSVEFSGHQDGFGWFDDLTFTPDTTPVARTTFGAIKALYR